MKKTLATLGLIATLYGCGSSPQPVTESTSTRIREESTHEVKDLNDTNAQSAPSPTYPPVAVTPIRPEPRRGIITESDHTIPSQYFEFEHAIRGSLPTKVTNNNYQYSLEKIIVNGEAYYLEANRSKQENELEFILKKDNEAIPFPGYLESDTVYIPTKYMIGKSPATEFKLKKDGDFGIKVKRTTPPVNKIDNGIVYVTQEDVEFAVKATAIPSISNPNEKEAYFTPFFENPTTKIKTVMFLPVKSTQVAPTPDDRIIMRNTVQGMYELVGMPAKDYDARTASTKTSGTGEAVEIK